MLGVCLLAGALLVRAELRGKVTARDSPDRPPGRTEAVMENADRYLPSWVPPGYTLGRTEVSGMSTQNAPGFQEVWTDSAGRSLHISGGPAEPGVVAESLRDPPPFPGVEREPVTVSGSPGVLGTSPAGAGVFWAVGREAFTVGGDFPRERLLAVAESLRPSGSGTGDFRLAAPIPGMSRRFHLPLAETLPRTTTLTYVLERADPSKPAWLSLTISRRHPLVAAMDPPVTGTEAIGSARGTLSALTDWSGAPVEGVRIAWPLDGNVLTAYVSARGLTREDAVRFAASVRPVGRRPGGKRRRGLGRGRDEASARIGRVGLKS